MGELIQSANTWLQGESDPQQRIRLCLRLAKWYGDDLGHPEYAQPYYAQIVQLDPTTSPFCGRWAASIARTVSGSSSGRP